MIMKSRYRFSSKWPIFIGLFLCALFASPSVGQESNKFAVKGSTELGGDISFQSSTPITNGIKGDAFTSFSVAPFIGYFVSDGFEIGADPFGIRVSSVSGRSSTAINMFFTPSYNFRTSSIAYPFIAVLLGYTSSLSGSSTRSGFSWGGRAGVKLAVTDKGLLNLGVKYLLISLNPSGASKRSGRNELTVSAGWTVWF